MKRTAPMQRTALRRSSGDAKLSVPVFRPKPCKTCKKVFTPVRSIQPCCTHSCEVHFALARLEKAKAKRDADEKRDTRVKLEAIKPRSKWLAEAQAAFNAYIRARDANVPCVSCGRWHEGSWDAGHLFTTGARPELRFDEQNVHRQCVPCNRHMHGNVIMYRAELVRRLGQAAVDRLEGPCPPKHYSLDDLKAIKAKYTALARELKKASE